MQREKNKATCRRFIQQIFNEGELSSIRDFVSNDFVHHQLDDVTVPSGHTPDWFADMVRSYRLTFPDLRVEVESQIAESDRVVNCLRMQGTQESPLLGLGESGKAVNIMGIRIDRLAEDKITESWVHWDSLGLLQQMGALPDLVRAPLTAARMEQIAALPSPNPLPIVVPVPRLQRMPRPSPAAAKLKPAA